VLARLRAAFVACPGLAVYSRSPTHFERIPGTDDGTMLLAAVTTVLDRSDRVALLERTRAEIQGLTISELCDAKGWHRPCFYKRTDATAERVAVYLNEQAIKGGQKSANAEKYGCIAARCLKNNQRKIKRCHAVAIGIMPDGRRARRIRPRLPGRQKSPPRASLPLITCSRCCGMRMPTRTSDSRRRSQYVHPKLATIQHGNDPNSPLNSVTDADRIAVIKAFLTAKPELKKQIT
jgi:hypothetical protein